MMNGEKNKHNKQPAFSFLSIPFWLFILLFISRVSPSAKAQEIDFGSYSSLYTVTVSELNPTEDLEFGLIIVNEGVKQIELADAKVLLLEGVKYLDVLLDIQADNELLLDGNLDCVGDPTCSLPFSLQAAYANRGENNMNHAIMMNVSSNLATAQIPVLHRGMGPPGPPPTPVHGNYNPALYMETAFIYLYGAVTVGNVDAGNYSANITITVNYD